VGALVLDLSARRRTGRERRGSSCVAVSPSWGAASAS